MAHDLERGAWRTFRVDRILSVRGTGARFARTEQPDAAAMVAKAVSVTVYPCQASLRLHQSLQQARERYGAAQLLKAETATTCLLTVGAGSWRDRGVPLGTATRFTVLGPEEMRVAVHELTVELSGST